MLMLSLFFFKYGDHLYPLSFDLIFLDVIEYKMNYKSNKAESLQ